MMANTIAFDILARDRASKTFDNVGRSSDGLGRKLGSMGKMVALGAGVAAVGGIAALGAAMVRGVKDAASYQDLQNKTIAVLKSTGNTAHTSVKAIQEHAGALESLSGVDEELIINSQNVLATFTKVRNGVGQGNQIFDQATEAALNMSTALGTDLQGSTIQLGKALNDPIKGITALSRVGVSFTKSQKEQIKTLVESGRTMDAQKLILGELSKEFGGAAQAAGAGFNGTMARLKDTLGDTARNIGAKLLPSITSLANGMNVFFTALTGGSELNEFDGGLRRVNNAAIRLNEFWSGSLAPTLRRFGGYISGNLWPALKSAYQTILPGVRQAMTILNGSVGKSSVTWKQVGDVLTQKIIPVVAKFMSYYLPYLAFQVRIVIEAVKAMVKVGQALYSAWRTAIAGVVRVFLSFVGAVVNGAAKAFGWIPGIGKNLTRAAGEFNSFRDSVNRALAGTKDHKRINISAPGASAVMQQLADIRWQADHIPRSVTIGVANKLAGMRAAGGPITAGKSYLVGEKGPEVVTPTRNGYVHPNGSGPGGDFSVTVPLVLEVDGNVLHRSLLKVKRTKGGVSLGLA